MGLHLESLERRQGRCGRVSAVARRLLALSLCLSRRTRCRQSGASGWKEEELAVSHSERPEVTIRRGALAPCALPGLSRSKISLAMYLGSPTSPRASMPSATPSRPPTAIASKKLMRPRLHGSAFDLAPGVWRELRDTLRPVAPPNKRCRRAGLVLLASSRFGVLRARSPRFTPHVTRLRSSVLQTATRALLRNKTAGVQPATCSVITFELPCLVATFSRRLKLPSASPDQLTQHAFALVTTATRLDPELAMFRHDNHGIARAPCRRNRDEPDGPRSVSRR